MSKAYFLKMLEDPVIVERLFEIVEEARKATNQITPNDKKKVTHVKNWWDEHLGHSSSELNLFQLQELAGLINKHGREAVKGVLLNAIQSPLRKGDHFMKQYLSDLGWCIRAGNYDKIKNGAYDTRKGGDDVYRNENSNENLNDQLLR